MFDLFRILGIKKTKDFRLASQLMFTAGRVSFSTPLNVNEPPPWLFFFSVCVCVCYDRYYHVKHNYSFLLLFMIISVSTLNKKSHPDGLFNTLTPPSNKKCAHHDVSVTVISVLALLGAELKCSRQHFWANVTTVKYVGKLKLFHCVLALGS